MDASRTCPPCGPTRRAGDASERSVVGHRAGQGQAPTFFFIGGFLDVARHLGDDCLVYVLDWPAERKTTEITFADIAAQCVASMRGVQPTGPYQFGGHCFGATVAFAIANLLESQGEQTSFLVLLDPPDPTFRRDNNHLNDRVRYHFGKLLNHSSPLSAMTYLWQRITNVRRRTLNTVRGQDGSEVYRDFSTKIFPDRAIVVLAKDTFLSERPEDDPRMEWRSWARDGIELIESPGDHITFCREPLVETLGQQLATRLDAIE